jgi:hypothetical protein
VSLLGHSNEQYTFAGYRHSSDIIFLQEPVISRVLILLASILGKRAAYVYIRQNDSFYCAHILVLQIYIIYYE